MLGKVDGTPDGTFVGMKLGIVVGDDEGEFVRGVCVGTDDG